MWRGERKRQNIRQKGNVGLANVCFHIWNNTAVGRWGDKSINAQWKGLAYWVQAGDLSVDWNGIGQSYRNGYEYGTRQWLEKWNSSVWGVSVSHREAMGPSDIVCEGAIFHSLCILIPQWGLGFTSFGVLCAVILFALHARWIFSIWIQKTQRKKGRRMVLYNPYCLMSVATKLVVIVSTASVQTLATRQTLPKVSVQISGPVCLKLMWSFSSQKHVSSPSWFPGHCRYATINGYSSVGRVGLLLGSSTGNKPVCFQTNIMAVVWAKLQFFAQTQGEIVFVQIFLVRGDDGL